MSSQASRRVMRVITRLNVGGPARQAVYLNRALPALGYDSRLVTGVEGPREGRIDPIGAGTTQIDSLRRAVSPIHDLRAMRSLRSSIAACVPSARFVPSSWHDWQPKRKTMAPNRRANSSKRTSSPKGLQSAPMAVSWPRRAHPAEKCRAVTARSSRRTAIRCAVNLDTWSPFPMCRSSASLHPNRADTLNSAARSPARLRTNAARR